MENICFDVCEDQNVSSEMLAVDTASDPQAIKTFISIQEKQEFVYEFDDAEILKVKSEVFTETAASHEYSRNTTLKSKNGIQWHTQPTISPNTDIGILSQTATAVQTSSSPLEAWSLLIDEELLSLLVAQTNLEIRRRKSKVAEKRPTDIIEMRAWLGLNYLCGIFRNSPHNGPFDELWSLELGFAIFRAIMTQKRFEFLADCVGLADKAESKKNPLGGVNKFWKTFFVNCNAHYMPSGYCVVDEHIVQESNLLRLKDAKTLYLLNGVICCGKTLESEIDSLLTHCDNLCVALPERYTLMALVQELLKNGISSVGALSTKSEDIPRECLADCTAFELHAEEHNLFTGLDASVSPTGLLLASGVSHFIDPQKLYVCTRRASLNFVEATANYSTYFATSTKTNRLVLDFLHELLNYAALNAWVLYRLSNPQHALIKQRDFQRQLGLDLTQQHMNRSMRSANVEVSRRLQICDVLGKPVEKLLSELTNNATSVDAIDAVSLEHQQNPDFFLLMGKKLNTHRRCRKCRGQASSKTMMRCQQCLTPLCNRHLILRCSVCTGVKQSGV